MYFFLIVFAFRYVMCDGLDKSVFFIEELGLSLNFLFFSIFEIFYLFHCLQVLLVLELWGDLILWFLAEIEEFVGFVWRGEAGSRLSIHVLAGF